MSRVVLSFLIAAMLLIAFFTYQAHNASIKSLRARYNVQEILAAYDDITLQIKDAYEQVLIFNLSGDRSHIDRYLGSEENIYRKLSDIETMTEQLDQADLPSDSLRILISRQFLRMEKFRLRSDESVSGDSVSLLLLGESLADQQHIQNIIDSDKDDISKLTEDLAQSGVLTPAFIAFLVLLGIGSVIMMSRQMGKIESEVNGIEDKLRRNQQILSEEIEDREKLQSMKDLIWKISDEFWLEVKPVRDLDEVVDFHVNMMNEKAEAILKPEGESSLQRILTKIISEDAMEAFIDEMVESVESRKPVTTHFKLQEKDTMGEYTVMIQPNSEIILIKGIYKGYVAELEKRNSILLQENDIWFKNSKDKLAVLSAQGKITRMNPGFSAFAGTNVINGTYLWEIPVFEQAGKHELRAAIRELTSSSDQVALDELIPGGTMRGIFDKRHELVSILFSIPANESA